MNKQAMLTLLKDFWKTDYSENSIAVAESTIDSYDNFDDMIDNLPFEVERELIYYSQSFNYLMDNNITDFKDAISNGANDVTSIASYYLYEETTNLLYDLRNLVG